MTEQSFAATILFRSDSADEAYVPFYNETMAIIRAADIEQARERALELGTSGATEFTSVDGVPIRWTFHELFDLRPTLTDGMTAGDVIARFFHDIDSYKSAFKS